MSERFISLKCQSCGAPLEVYEDMERFSCGFCGSEMVVERRGGTVRLKPVLEAIQKVQVGTDRTAAELALVRLRAEIESVTKEKVQTDNLKGCGIGCLVIIGLIGMGAIAGKEVGIGVVILLFLVAIVVIAVNTSSGKSQELEEKIADLKRQVSENEEIVRR